CVAARDAHCHSSAVPLPYPAVKIEIEHAVYALHIHRQALEPVGELARDRIAVEAPDLLEIGELRQLHGVEPHLPAEPPSAERRALPVVLDEADVVVRGIDSNRVEALQIKVLNVGRRRLEDHLELIIVLKPVGILAIAAVLGPA